jgi:hypothetical protein
MINFSKIYVFKIKNYISGQFNVFSINNIICIFIKH